MLSRDVQLITKKITKLCYHWIRFPCFCELYNHGIFKNNTRMFAIRDRISDHRLFLKYFGSTAKFLFYSFSRLAFLVLSLALLVIKFKLVDMKPIFFFSWNCSEGINLSTMRITIIKKQTNTIKKNESNKTDD